MQTTDERDFGKHFLEDIAIWFSGKLDPIDVFPEDKLEEWARSNGYVHESELE